jgi:hypothetical protein
MKPFQRVLDASPLHKQINELALHRDELLVRLKYNSYSPAEEIMLFLDVFTTTAKIETILHEVREHAQTN